MQRNYCICKFIKAVNFNFSNYTRAYSLKYIEKVAEIDNSVLPDDGGLTESHSTTFMNSIADLYALVKQYDKDIVPAPEASLYLLNDDGTPKVFPRYGRKIH